MQNDIFQEKPGGQPAATPKPARRTEMVILCACLAVLILLTARIFLFSSSSPKSVTAPEAHAVYPVAQAVPAKPIKPEDTAAVETPEKTAAMPAAAPETDPTAAVAPKERETLQATARAVAPVSAARPPAPAKTAVETDPLPASAPTETITAPDPEKVPVQPPDASRYIVQAGAFSSLKHADQLAIKIKSEGFGPSILKVKDTKRKRLYIVTIGEYRERQSAEAAAARFESALQITPVVRPLTPGLTEAIIGDRKPAGTSMPQPHTAAKDNRVTAEELPPAHAPPAETAVPAKTARIKPPDAVPPPMPAPRDLIRQGAFPDAAAVFRERLRLTAHRYSIRLEVDCALESVRTAFQAGKFDENMFLLPITLGDRSCYMVLWGLYETGDEAAKDMTTLPPFFTNQSPPPKPVQLSTYLEPR